MKTESIAHILLRRPEIKNHIDELKDHHEDSALHCIRVSELVVAIGRENNLSTEDIELLGLAGLLHDLGKCDIGDEILSKSSDLDNQERTKVEEHPRRGFLKLDHPSFKEARKIVVGHHEYKLNPYPRDGTDRRNDAREIGDRRNSDKKIGELTEILAVADIFDALASRRSYKEPFSNEKISEIMHEQFTGDRLYLKQILDLVK